MLENGKKIEITYNNIFDKLFTIISKDLVKREVLERLAHPDSIINVFIKERCRDLLYKENYTEHNMLDYTRSNSLTYEPLRQLIAAIYMPNVTLKRFKRINSYNYPGSVYGYNEIPSMTYKEYIDYRKQEEEYQKKLKEKKAFYKAANIKPQYINLMEDQYYNSLTYNEKLEYLNEKLGLSLEELINMTSVDKIALGIEDVVYTQKR